MVEQCSTEGCTNPRAYEHSRSRQCLECLARYRRTYYHKNREKQRQQENKRRAQTRFGTQPGEYDRMLLAQGGKCANPECRVRSMDAPYGRLMLDAEHGALLCDTCNRTAKTIGSNAALLRGLADFLEGRRKTTPMILSKALSEPIKIPDQPDEPSEEGGAGRSR